MMSFLVTQNWFYDVWFLPIIISNLILQLVNGYHSQDNATLRLLEEMDWYIVPLVNPDGYVYSHEWVPVPYHCFYYNSDFGFQNKIHLKIILLSSPIVFTS